MRNLRRRRVGGRWQQRENLDAEADELPLGFVSGGELLVVERNDQRCNRSLELVRMGRGGHLWEIGQRPAQCGRRPSPGGQPDQGQVRRPAAQLPADAPAAGLQRAPDAAGRCGCYTSTSKWPAIGVVGPLPVTHCPPDAIGRSARSLGHSIGS